MSEAREVRGVSEASDMICIFMYIQGLIVLNNKSKEAQGITYPSLKLHKPSNQTNPLNLTRNPKP